MYMEIYVQHRIKHFIQLQIYDFVELQTHNLGSFSISSKLAAI